MAQQAALCSFTSLPGICGRSTARLRSCHTLEIPFVFDNLETAELTGDDPGRLAPCDRMSRAWLAFARHGTPGHAGLPDWPAYSAAARDTMIFDRECRMECDPYGKERQIFEANRSASKQSKFHATSGTA